MGGGGHGLPGLPVAMSLVFLTKSVIDLLLSAVLYSHKSKNNNQDDFCRILILLSSREN